MFEVEFDSNEFGGFDEGRSRFTVTMHAVPRVGETVHIASELIPAVCFAGTKPLRVIEGGRRDGSVALEVMVVSHSVDSTGHRPHVFCRQPRPAFNFMESSKEK